MVKAVARRLNGGGPYVVVKNIPEWKNCSRWKKRHRRGKMLPVDKMSQHGQHVTLWKACHTWMNCHTLSNPHYCVNGIIACSSHPKSYSQQCSVRFFGLTCCFVCNSLILPIGHTLKVEKYIEWQNGQRWTK